MHKMTQLFITGKDLGIHFLNVCFRDIIKIWQLRPGSDSQDSRDIYLFALHLYDLTKHLQSHHLLWVAV